MRIRLFGLMVLVCVVFGGVGVEAGEKGLQEVGVYDVGGKGDGMNDEYLYYLPEGYDESKRGLPLILFLHGAGERGDDIERVRGQGLPKYLEAVKGKGLPFVIVSPQCERGKWWGNKGVKPFLDFVIKKYKIDKRRVYITGLSMGGFGSWAMAGEYPEMFAAVAPICGAGDVKNAGRLKDVPLWVFHGAKDRVIKIKGSRDMVDAIKKVGGKPKFTIYPDAGHDSWTETYKNKKLYEWFLSHEKVKKDKKKVGEVQDVGVYGGRDYLYYLPEGYEKAEKGLPLILFLHGAGARGDNIEKVRRGGLPGYLEREGELPFVVVSPQCRKGGRWSSRELKRFLDHVLKTYKIDKKRVYLTGLSMGGFGSFTFGADHSAYFAAVAPICGGGQVRKARGLKKTPLWVFHGAKDKVVPLSRSEEMVKAVKKLGGDVKLTVYPEAGHNAWTATYKNAKLYEWFLSHEKKGSVE